MLGKPSYQARAATGGWGGGNVYGLSLANKPRSSEFPFIPDRVIREIYLLRSPGIREEGKLPKANLNTCSCYPSHWVRCGTQPYYF